jgi:hypothetical protein
MNLPMRGDEQLGLALDDAGGADGEVPRRRLAIEHRFDCTPAPCPDRLLGVVWQFGGTVRKTTALLRVLEGEGREPCFRSLICGITASAMRIFFARLVNRNSLRSS